VKNTGLTQRKETYKLKLYGSAQVLEMIKFVSGKELKWPKDKVKSLGLWISTDPELSASLNYNEKLEKVKEILRCWKYRRLTLLGKITVIKSLVVSQLVYLLSPLRSNYRVLNEINDLLYTFLWNGKGDKIVKRKVMINDFGDGGLRAH